jgi:hypothetical protein
MQGYSTRDADSEMWTRATTLFGVDLEESWEEQMNRSELSKEGVTGVDTDGREFGRADEGSEFRTREHTPLLWAKPTPRPPDTTCWAAPAYSFAPAGLLCFM